MALPDSINIGTAPNNGTGDPLRTAFQKSNAREDYLEANKEDKANKGAANGYAPLDANTQIPEQYIPFDSVLAQKVQVSTGLLEGLTITINSGDNATFDIASGVGFVTDNTDPLNPLTTKVEYAGSTGNAVTNIATEPATYIALDVNGNIIQKGSPFTNAESRDYIVIGSIIHSNNTNITLVNSISNYIVSPTSQLHDLIRIFGIINDVGNRITANGANLSIDKSQGVIFKLGLNPGTKNPHERTLASLTAATFRYRLSDGTEFSDTTTLNVNQYESGGALVNVPSNNYQIQTVALFQSNALRVQPGQQTYATLDAAANAITTRNFITESNIAENAIIVGYIIVKEGTTSLQNTANAKFVNTNRFGDVSGGSGASTSFGYTPEDVANKAIDFSVINNTLYPSVQAVVEYINAQGFITDYTVTEQDVIDALGYTPEDQSNKAINFTVSNDTLFPTVKAVVDYVASLNHITETELKTTPRLFEAQQGFAEFALTDAATVNWNLNKQVARLQATSEVGNTRTLTVSNSNPGVNYQLTYIQDATGGRDLDLSNFDSVYGDIDLEANKESIINVVVTNAGTSFVVITSDVGVGIDNITEIPNRSYNDLQSKPLIAYGRELISASAQDGKNIPTADDTIDFSSTGNYLTETFTSIGTSALNWNIKGISQSITTVLKITNKNTQVLTLTSVNTNNEIWEKGTESNSITVPTGESIDMYNDGEHWTVRNRY